MKIRNKFSLNSEEKISRFSINSHQLRKKIWDELSSSYDNVFPNTKRTKKLWKEFPGRIPMGVEIFPSEGFNEILNYETNSLQIVV